VNLKRLVERYKAGEIEIPEGGELALEIDGGKPVRARIHPGGDDEGEELGDPTYLDLDNPEPIDLLEEALRLLGLPTERA
jgi:hypothetical protein